MNNEPQLDVLMYVFETYLETHKVESPDKDNKTIVTEMLKAGFQVKEIDGALGWFTELSKIQDYFCQAEACLSKQAFRIFTEYEKNKINVEARSFLLFLERSDVIDPVSRELIIDRVMALNEPRVGVPEIKWVGLMVLFSQAQRTEQLTVLEELILFGNYDAEH